MDNLQGGGQEQARGPAAGSGHCCSAEGEAEQKAEGEADQGTCVAWEGQQASRPAHAPRQW